ncbi:MAG: PhzF family phenazine biosynthesis protein [Chloroflexota bacterium]
MTQIIYQVDAFTSQPFAGNPAGVCILPKPADEAWMQAIAREMNLSETAFLVRQADGFDLRWFTPAAEVRLCGHATLASAHTLWQTGTLQSGEQARFHTLSGLLTARQRGEWIEMDFPVRRSQPVEPPAGLAEALGVTPLSIGKDVDDYLIEVESETIVRELKPDFSRLGKLPTRGVIVTARSADPNFDFVSRFFAPAVGIDEDPVTGSAHCCLMPFWAEKLGKSEMTAFQASARGGIVRVKLAGERVLLSGQAVTVMRGELI